MNQKIKTLIVSVLFIAAITACSDEKSATPKKFTYTISSSWSCEGNFCQDVYELKLIKGTLASFAISDLTNGSIGQIALYAPGVVLGGSNLFTNDTNELGCTIDGGCDGGAAGLSKEMEISVTGVYTFVVTRNNDLSCGSSGDYSLEIVSTEETPEQISNDIQSSAPATRTCN
jgi:hypothetical protein